MKKHALYDHPIGGSVVAMLIAFAVYAASQVVGIILLGREHSDARSAIMLGFMAALLLIHLFWFRGELHHFFKFKDMGRGVLLGWSMLIECLVVIIPNLIAGEKVGNVAYAFFLGVVPGLCEEVICRIVPLSIVMRHPDKKNTTKVIIITSIFFGLLHCMNLIAGADPVATLWQVLYATGIGVLLSVIYVRTGNLWSVILLHTLVDTASFLWAVNQGANAGVLSTTMSTGENIQTLVMTALFYINAFVLLRKKEEGTETWKTMWQ